MLKLLAAFGLGSLIFFAANSDFEISPQTRKVLLSSGRSVMGFFNRNAKVTDEYLRCLELQPTQPKYCKERFFKQTKEANPVDVSKPVKISVTRIGIGNISVKAEPDVQ